MQSPSFEEVLDTIVAQDARYHRDAYHFVREALDFTQKLIARTKKETGHISGQELLGGIREYAVKQYGPMAITVLDEWGVKSTQDFGEIVFNMVEKSLLAKTEKDSRDDFREGYDFNDAFRKPFQPVRKATSATKEPAPAPASTPAQRKLH
ncbi:MAG TPA: Minf_1886 family protein [Verrucomicrobiae bacterium]|nr:Minf_1886 family protein [Verrucomicrobiae bacterium]